MPRCRRPRDPGNCPRVTVGPLQRRDAVSAGRSFRPPEAVSRVEGHVPGAVARLVGEQPPVGTPRAGQSSAPCRSPAQVGCFGRAAPRRDAGRASCRARPDHVRVRSAASAAMRQHRVRELVERLEVFRLRRLDHDRLFDDQREVDRRRVEAVVEQPLRDVERVHAVLLPQRRRRARTRACRSGRTAGRRRP